METLTLVLKSEGKQDKVPSLFDELRTSKQKEAKAFVDKSKQIQKQQAEWLSFAQHLS